MTILPREMGKRCRGSKIQKSSSKPQLSSLQIEIAPNRRRNRNFSCRRSQLYRIFFATAIVIAAQSKLRRIVVETATVLSPDRNRAKSSSKPQLSAPSIEIVMNLARTTIGIAAYSSNSLMHSDLQDMRQEERKMMLDKEQGV